MNKRGLGKGLSALIPTSSYSSSVNYDPEKDLLQEVPLEEIIPNSYQPRKNFDPDKLAELAASIKEHGLVQPIIIRPHLEGYEIVAGERRFRACKQVGLKKIPAIIKTLTDKEMSEIALIENIQRQDLNSIEEARAYKKLMDDFGLTQEEIAKRVGKSRPFIANFLRLLQLPDKILDLVETNKISAGHARALLTMEDGTEQLELARKIIDENLSVRETEKLAKKLPAKNTTSNLKIKDIQEDTNFKDIQENLQNKFGTKVLIKEKGNGGKIEIEYYNQHDLQRIIEVISEEYS